MKKKDCTSVFRCIFVLCIVSSFMMDQAIAGTFSEDFEAGLGDWHADNGVWEVGTPTAGPDSCHSGSLCAGTVLSGDYPNGTDSHFISPTIMLPAVTGTDEIHLRFWHWFSYYIDTTVIYDFGQVTVSEYVEDGQAGAWSSFLPVSTEVRGTSAIWTQSDVDLTAYASKKVRIAFYHQDAGYNTVRLGWYIDDIEITSPQGIWVVDFDADGDGVPDSSDQCPQTPENACVDNVGCSSEGSYTQEQVDQIVANILNWGDTNEDGKIGLAEAIKALGVVSGGE